MGGLKKSLAISEVVRGRGNPLGWRGDVESGEREGEEKKTGPPGEHVHVYQIYMYVSIHVCTNNIVYIY